MCTHWSVCMNRFRSESTASWWSRLACPLTSPCVYVVLTVCIRWWMWNGFLRSRHRRTSDTFLSISLSRLKACINNFFVTLINAMALDVDCWLNSFRDFSRPRFYLLFLMFYVHTSSCYYSFFFAATRKFPAIRSINYSLSNFLIEAKIFRKRIKISSSPPRHEMLLHIKMSIFPSSNMCAFLLHFLLLCSFFANSWDWKYLTYKT